MDRQGVILNEDMKNFTSNMNMTQKMFDGFLNCELGMFGSIQKNHNLVDLQKTFYSAATFNPHTQSQDPFRFMDESLPPVTSRIRWHGWKYRIMMPPRISVLTLV